MRRSGQRVGSMSVVDCAQVRRRVLEGASATRMPQALAL